jgi:hypothetical protein
MASHVAVAVLLLLSLAACGGASSTPTGAATPAASSEESEDFPADASATHYHPIHHAALGPIYGSGCPDFGACGCGGATTLAEEFSCQLDYLAANDIPISAYLFDGSAWSQRSSASDNECTGPDCCAWKLGDPALQRLARDDVRGLLHYWGGCHAAEQYKRAHDRLGHSLLGFYLDDGSSDDELEQVSEFMQTAEPGDWECVAKAYQNREPSTTNTGLSKWANSAYVGDLSFDFSGLKDAIDRVVAKGRYIPAPYAEFTGYAYLDSGSPDEEIYFRRLQFGALQPVMAHTPYGNSDPWRPEYSPALLASYRYYAWLHRELVPYFYSYAYRMYETPGARVVRRGPMTTSLRVGNELYVPVVTEPTRAMTIVLPSGQWIDYWDESRLLSGTLADYPVPLGREPIFVRAGALVPLDVQRAYAGHGTRESAASLTLLVYPSGSSSFRYREDARTPWITFSSTLVESTLTLGADGTPSQPVIYRIARWSALPTSVSVNGLQVRVNGVAGEGGGGDAKPVLLSSEAAVEASRVNAWFYDAHAQRLIVKLIP